jgi:preprotein translocase subunit SecG
MQVLNIFHVLIAIALVAFILIQKGQGATAGAAFGSGASGTVFGARGAGNFLSRTTWVLAALFCTISLTMAVIVSRMSAAPEDDLGVVGSSLVAPATEGVPEDLEISVGPAESTESDLPSAGIVTDVIDEGEVMDVSVADDLPEMDGVSTEVIEEGVSEDSLMIIDASGDGSDGAGPDTDGS